MSNIDNPKCPYELDGREFKYDGTVLAVLPENGLLDHLVPMVQNAWRTGYWSGVRAGSEHIRQPIPVTGTIGGGK